MFKVSKMKLTVASVVLCLVYVSFSDGLSPDSQLKEINNDRDLATAAAFLHGIHGGHGGHHSSHGLGGHDSGWHGWGNV